MRSPQRPRSSSSSSDEYDAISDPFGPEIDWNAIPGLADTQESVTAEPLPPTPSLSVDNPSGQLAAAATPSSEYSFDELDDSFFAEVDAIEKGQLQGPSEPGASCICTLSMRWCSIH